jgi:hypothetical protein
MFHYMNYKTLNYSVGITNLTPYVLLVFRKEARGKPIRVYLLMSVYRNVLESELCNLTQSSSCSSSGSIVSDYGLDDRGSIPDRGRGFFF